MALLSFGNLPAWALVYLGTVFTMGGYHVVEGLQDIAYGKDGGITTESVNLLKNLMGEDAYNTALTTGHITANVLMIYKDIDDLRKLISGKLANKKAANAAIDGITPSSVLDDLPVAGTTDDLLPVGNADDLIEGGTYSGDLMSVEEATRYSEHWRELGIGSDKTWKEFIEANPNGTIDNYLEIVQKQSPWPLGQTGTPTTLKSGDRFFMAVENDAPENLIGGFGVNERIDSTNFVRNNLAVKYDWKTSCNVIREFEVNIDIELNVNAGPVGPQIDLGADLYLPGDTTITQYDLFSNLGSGIKREDYVHIVDEYWVD